MGQIVKTKKKRTVFGSPKKFFKTLLEPDEEEEIPDQLENNEDFDNFQKNLRITQEKTGTIKVTNNTNKNEEKYKAVKGNKKVVKEGNKTVSNDKNVKHDRDRD